MGTRTEFDLDRHITTWRKQFLADSTFYSEEVEELENHVRDGVEHLMTTGLSEEEAFYETIDRLGSPDTLRPDYQRARPLSESSFTLARVVALCTFLIPMLIIPLTGPLSTIIHALGGHAATLVLYLGAVLLIIWADYRRARPLSERSLTLARVLTLGMFLIPLMIIPMGGLSNILYPLGGHTVILVLYLGALLTIIWDGSESTLTSARDIGLRTGSVLVIAGMAIVMVLLNLLSPFTVLLYPPMAPFLAIVLSWISKGRVPVGVAPALVVVFLVLSWVFGGAHLAVDPPTLTLLTTYAAMDATLGWIVERALADRHQTTATLQPA